jgi:large subunit ribosomal protein L17
MRHRVAGRHLSRTSAHRLALRRNLAQSLFQYGQIETTLTKAKEVRPFVERLITIARKGTLQSRQRIISMLGDRALITKDQQEQYDAMSEARRLKVRRARSGRRHRAGKVPASYNKKKIPFVAHSVVHKLIDQIAPKYRDRPGGYTRIISLSKRRVGDNSYLALLQLVGEEVKSPEQGKKTVGLRRQKTLGRIRFLEGKSDKPQGRRRGGKAPQSSAKAASSAEKAAPGPEARQAPVAADHPPPQPSEESAKDES